MFQEPGANKPEEEKLMIEEPKQPDESRFTPGLLVGGFDQDEALGLWRLDTRPGLLECTSQAALWTPVSPGKGRRSTKAFSF